MRFTSIGIVAASLLVMAAAAQAGNPGKGYPGQYPPTGRQSIQQQQQQQQYVPQQYVPQQVPGKVQWILVVPRVETQVRWAVPGGWQYVAPKQKPRPAQKPYLQGAVPVQTQSQFYQQQTVQPQTVTYAY